MAKKYDHEAIEADYRAGQLSIRAIAEKHGCSEAAIRKWALKFGWSRDLSKQVKSVTKAKLTNKAVESVPPREDGKPFTEAQIIDYASNDAVAVVTAHRSLAAEYLQITQTYGAKLREQLTAGRLVVEAPNGDPIEIDIPLEYVGKCLNSATQSLDRLVKIQRQAYSMDDKDEATKDPYEELTDDDLNTRINHFIGQEEQA